ncbi:MAG: response regulator [Candidatus Wallbacteria bacterium]|nr:response regulator [Candidatus Wallbacteria bacterium]
MTDKKILAVDDEEIVLKMYKEYFQFHGVDLKTSSSEADARRILGEESFDIVILDMKLDTASGKDLLIDLKQSHPATKYIFVTAYATDEVVDELSRLGVAEVIRKPCTIRTIYESVQKLTLSS